MKPSNKITADRYHDFSYGHRVYQHESSCSHLHGHNGRVHFTITAPALDTIGRVLDFSVIKSLLCSFLEDEWDHKFLVWEKDPWAPILKELDPEGTVIVTFNPTAEQLAQYLVEVVGPKRLVGTGAVLISARFEETRKCAASFIKGE
jgi:6-pyruvoyltetrahydropterin/6-carboxytetrahydropterin synthase